MIDLEPLDDDCIQTMLLDQAEIYQKQMLEEIGQLIAMGTLDVTVADANQNSSRVNQSKDIDLTDKNAVKTYET